MSETLEEYLKTIYILVKRNGNVRVTDIAKELSCTKPTVNRAIKVLNSEEIVEYEAYSKITLTKKGEEIAEDILRKQETIKAFLVQVLDISNEKAQVEASNMRHAVSKETVDKLEEYIKGIIDVSKLECNYDPKSIKCKQCVKMKAKSRLRK